MLDYLKYWRVVRYFIKRKYGLSQVDEFDELLSWDKNRFEKLRQEGWIEVFRKKQGHRRVVYALTYKAQRVLTSVYKKLEGEEIPESKSSNPLFLADVSYNDKVYRNYIKKLNKSIRQ